MPSPHARISGTGFHVPGIVLDNEAIIEKFGLDISPEWIVERTGIVTRHWLEPGRTTSDMAVDAARAALADAGIGPADVDRIFVATVTPDHPTPATATIVARKLGARCMALDLSAACAGFVYGLDLAAASVRTGRARRVLVIAADTRSRFVDPKDRRAVVLFADAAAAAVVEASDVPGFLGFHTGGEGRSELGVWIPAGGATRPTTAETVAAGEHYVRMESKGHLFDTYFEFTVESVNAALAEAGLTLPEIDVVATHQGNALLVDAVLAKLGVPAAKGLNILRHHGSCSGAGMPLALAEARSQGRIREGQTVLLTAVGAGYTFASAVHRF
jgi:3-oxoacyl-[acyl-carrier-protein] synthase-3